MANALQQTARTAYLTFHQIVRDYSASWLQLTAPIMMASDATSLTEQRSYGQTLWEAHSASPTAMDIDSESHVTTVLDRDSLVTLSVPEVQRNPQLLIQEAANMAILFGYTVAEAFWTTVFALASTNHPYTGRPVFNSAAVNCVDSFTIIPPNGARSPGGASISQGNEYALAFAESAVTSMIAARNGYFDLAGNAVEANPGPDAQRPIMFGPADNQQEATGIAGQMAPLYDGAGIQWGVANMVENGYVIPPAGNTTSIWGLWYRSLTAGILPGQMSLTGPVAPMFFYGPDVSINPSPDKNFINILGSGGYAIRISGDVDRDVQLSTP